MRQKVTLEDFVYEYLSHNYKIMEEEVCDYFVKTDKAKDYCYKVCEYNHAQPECYKRFFDERFETWDIGDD